MNICQTIIHLTPTMDKANYFEGSFEISKPLDEETAYLLNGLSKTRRMKRCLFQLAKYNKISVHEAMQKYGIDGEFYFDPNDFKNYGQTPDMSIISYNSPPNRQPGIWCHWKYNSLTNSIEWNGLEEEFHNFYEWIVYIMEVILHPKNYTITGNIKWYSKNTIGSITIGDVGTVIHC